MATFNLDAATTAPDNGAQLFVVHGPPKVGKTTFVCGIEGVFLLCPEEGLKGVERPAPRFPRSPRTLAELYEAIDAFEAQNRLPEGGGRRYRHLAIDSLSWVEVMIQREGRATSPTSNLDDDFKSAWGRVAGFWDVFLERLTVLRRRGGVHVWLIAHAEQRQETNQKGETYPKWDLQLHKNVAPLVRRGADHIFFLNYVATVKKGGKGRRVVGEYKGRALYTRDCADHFAGSRSWVPAMLPATWADLFKALSAGKPAPEDRLRAQIAAVVAELGEEDRATVAADLKAAQTPRDLAAVLSRAEGLAAASPGDTEDADGELAAPEERAAPPPVAEDEESAEDAPLAAPVDPAWIALAKELQRVIGGAIAAPAVRQAMTQAAPLPHDLGAEVLVEGYRRLVELAADPKAEARVATEVAVSVKEGRIPQRLVNERIIPVRDARIAARRETAA